MLRKIIAARNLHNLLLLFTNVMQINNILQHPTLYIDINFPHFETCHAVYYLIKCIIDICIFTATGPAPRF